MARGRLWTAEDDEEFQRLCTQPLTYAQIGQRIGRSKGAVEQHFHKMHLDAAQRQARAEYNRRYQRETRAHACAGSGRASKPALRIPADVLAERDRAFSAARDLTAEIFGDPRPGRSALDRARVPAVVPAAGRVSEA